MNNENTRKTPSKRKKIARRIIVALIIIIIIIILLLLRNCGPGTPHVGPSGTGDYLNLTHNGKDYEYNGRITTICLTGLDTFEKLEELEEGEADADMVMLIVVDEYSKKLSVIAFNRHTLLGEQAGVLKDAYTGGDSVGEAVSDLIRGIPVAHNYTMNLSATPMMHGLVNEFEITVPNNDLVNVDPIFTKDNVIKLTPENVNTFVRDMGDGSDTGRMERHEAYMRGFLKMALNATTSSNLQIIQDAADTCAESDHVDTDIQQSKYGMLLNALSEIPLENISFYTVGGTYATVDGQTQFTIDQNGLLDILASVFYLEK